MIFPNCRLHINKTTLLNLCNCAVGLYLTVRKVFAVFKKCSLALYSLLRSGQSTSQKRIPGLVVAAEL